MDRLAPHTSALVMSEVGFYVGISVLVVVFVVMFAVTLWSSRKVAKEKEEAEKAANRLLARLENRPQ